MSAGMAAEISFDPYHKWLGIPPGDQPPHYYRLLALQPFESDAEVIHSAADQRMAHVRMFQSGIHSEASQKLLNELAAARICLLKPERKAAYDADLKAKLTPPSSPSQPTTAPAPAAPAAMAAVPPASGSPPAFSSPQSPWGGQPLPMAVPVLRPGAPIARPVSTMHTEASFADESDDLPFEVISGRRFRRPHAARKSDGLPLLLVAIAILLLVSMIVAVRTQWQAKAPQFDTVEVPQPGPRVAIPPVPPERRSKARPKPASAPQPPNAAETKVLPLPAEEESGRHPDKTPPSVPARSLPSVIDNADPRGFSLLGEGWQSIKSTDRAFRDSFASHPADDSEAAAVWTFDGLEPGKRYHILITWCDDVANDSQALYGVRDGDLGIRYLPVNQSIAPRADMEFEDHPFQKLATVKLHSTLLTVRLENRGKGIISADAVLLSRAPDRPAANAARPQPVPPPPDNPSPPSEPASPQLPLPETFEPEKQNES
jgi:hypothetical protein